MSATLERQVAALVVRVEHDRDQRLAELRASGAADAAAELDGARREARRLLRAATRAKRERVAARCRDALAALEAERRRTGFAAERERVAAALAALPMALERRWRDATHRRAWCQRALALAAARLIARDWCIALAPGGTPEERAALAAAATAFGARAEFTTSSERAGIAVRAGASIVDATVAGLTADRDAIAARLLALDQPAGSR